MALDIDSGSDDQENADHVSIDSTTDKLDTEFQKFMTDEKSLNLAFLSAFSGWRIIYKEKITIKLDVEEKETRQELEIDEYARMMNEAGSNYLTSVLKPLIAPIATTGNLTGRQIYNLLDGKTDVIIYALLDSIAIDGNPYEIKVYRIPDIISTVCEFYTVVSKMEKGFTLIQLSQSFITSVINRSGNAVQKSEGVIERLQRGLGISKNS